MSELKTIPVTDSLKGLIADFIEAGEISSRSMKKVVDALGQAMLKSCTSRNMHSELSKFLEHAKGAEKTSGSLKGKEVFFPNLSIAFNDASQHLFLTLHYTSKANAAKALKKALLLALGIGDNLPAGKTVAHDTGYLVYTPPEKQPGATSSDKTGNILESKEETPEGLEDNTPYVYDFDAMLSNVLTLGAKVITFNGEILTVYDHIMNLVERATPEGSQERDDMIAFLTETGNALQASNA